MKPSKWQITIHTAWANVEMGVGYADFDTEEEAREWASHLLALNGMEIFLLEQGREHPGEKL